MHGSLDASRSSRAMQMGFFAEAGPVQIFVSNHLIPEDFEFSALDDPCYVSSDEEVSVGSTSGKCTGGHCHICRLPTG